MTKKNQCDLENGLKEATSEEGVTPQAASRRKFLQATGVGAMAAIISSCAKEPLSTSDGGDTGGTDGDTDVDTDADADGDTDTDSDGDTDADADNDADSDADNDTDADTDNDADSDADNDTDADTDNDTDADADNDTDADTDNDADSDADNDTDADTDNDADADSDADTDADTDADSDADADSDSDVDTEITPTPANRVVRVIDSTATTWNGGSFSNFYQYTQSDVVDSMIEDGLLSLTGANNLTTAWRSLIPYSNGELVVIHINAYANNDNGRKNNVGEPISAVIHGLVDLLGIPADRIVVTDPSRRLSGSPADDRIISRCRYTDEISWDLYQGEDGSTISFTQGNNPGEERLARIMDEADHVIMMPVLSWHGFNWITGSMKMMMGSISDMGALHNLSDWRNGSALPDICMPFKDKVRLLVSDGLYGNIDGNSNPPNAFQTLGGQGGAHPASTLYLSRDMVALDSVMYDDLLDEARAVGKPKSGYGYGYLRVAASQDYQLGTFEMKDDTGAPSYSHIDFVEINRNNK